MIMNDILPVFSSSSVFIIVRMLNKMWLRVGSMNNETHFLLQEIVDDVMGHEEALTTLESAVNNVITLVDEFNQLELSSRL